MKCLVVVPAFPANMNGVFDFADTLVKALPECILVEFHLIQVNASSKKVLGKLFQSFSIIHLHYVGYGYSARGVPVNLFYALKTWKLTGDNRLLITFHELFASSDLPWKSSFYLGKLQKFLFSQLEKLADFSVVSCHAFSAHFKSEVSTLPVFSNIPSPLFITPFEKKSDHLIVWGNLEAKKNAYSFLKLFYTDICKCWKIDKILDIGEVSPIPSLFPIPIIQYGFLPPNEISCLLSASKMAIFTVYSPEYFSKSGIFAAFAAHNMAVLVAPSRNDYFANLDGLHSRSHFQKINEMHYQSAPVLASQLSSWYAKHALTEHIKGIYLPIFSYFDH